MLEIRTRLRSNIESVLNELLPTDGRFALLDFPDHDNIGDSAIYLGEIDFLGRRGLKPSFVFTNRGFEWSAMESAIADGPILLHGGGNLGDLWPSFQEERERVVERYAGRPIVQLPQTILFRSEDRADRFARIVERHGAFTLLVRDEPSFAFATRKFQCDVRLCPDMAFAMRDLRRRPASCDLLLHLRVDQEAAGTYDTHELEASGRAIRLDWPPEDKSEKRSMYRASRRHAMIKGLLSLSFDRNDLRRRRYERIAEMRIGRGVKLLSLARAVVTDRLHGHILCVLLDIPHIVIDNNYGKVSNFMAAWGTGSSRSRLASSIEEAIGIVEAGDISR
jgi:pyruvyl transferase EpsO